MGGGALVGRTTQANLGTNFILGFVFIYSYNEWICSKYMISLTLSWWWWWWLALLVVTGQWHDGGSDRAPPTPQSDCLTRVQIASDSNLRDTPTNPTRHPPQILLTLIRICAQPLSTSFAVRTIRLGRHSEGSLLGQRTFTIRDTILILCSN